MSDESLLHPRKDGPVRLQIDQAPRARNRRMIEYELVDRKALGVDPVRTGATDADHDQRDTGPAQHKSEPVGEPRLPREIAEHESGRTGGEGGADDDGRGSGPSQTK